MTMEMELTKDQEMAMEAMRAGRNVFLTGDAGTGKSYLLNAFLEECAKGGRRALAMAPTGVAAQRLAGGLTIHWALGLEPRFQDPLSACPPPHDRLLAADVVVIDEFSMCRIDLFERVMRIVERAGRESGAKQLIVAGDPFQLPPVTARGEREALAERYADTTGFAFHSSLWDGLGLEPHVLRQVVRQEDAAFARMLSLARVGDRSCIPFFNERAIKSPDAAPEGAVWLCPTKRAARRVNDERLAGLAGKAHVFEAEAEGDVRPSDKPADDRLELKVGARVMVLSNEAGSDVSYANGSMGTVLAIQPDSDSPVIVELDGGNLARFGKKEWEITRSFVSEVESADAPEGMSPAIVTEVVGTFKQIPLKLAWAVTIHKAQGKSFDDVCVDTRTFETGQLYVGLSRARTLEGLHVYPKIRPGRLRADGSALEFYDSLMESREAAA